MKFSHRLREMRRRMGLTQADFAEKIGLSASYIHQLEAEKKMPSDAVVKLLDMVEQSPLTRESISRENVIREHRVNRHATELQPEALWKIRALDAERKLSHISDGLRALAESISSTGADLTDGPEEYKTPDKPKP